MFQRGKLLRESEWTRVYEGELDSRRVVVHESKFLADGLKVSAESIRARWPALSFEERMDFANAFGAGGEVTAEDERVLDFLMEGGDFPVWMATAQRLRHHHDKDRVLAFLVERIREEGEHKANFFQAIELMGDKRALPALRAAYDAYKTELEPPNGPPKPFDYFDYLACCRALWILESSTEYKKAIQALVKHRDARISASARQVLRGWRIPPGLRGNDESKRSR